MGLRGAAQGGSLGKKPRKFRGAKEKINSADAGAVPEGDRPFSLSLEECRTGKPGIGGEMVAAKQRQAAKSKPRGSGSQKKSCAGTAQLKTAADKKLKEHSEKIAESLYNNLVEGNVTCGKLLIALAEGQIDCEDEAVVNRLRSMAEELASEPEWDGELDEAEAEAGLKRTD